MTWKTVLCTHEEKQDTSSGPWPNVEFNGVALPSRKAIWLWVELENPANGYTCFAEVRDVGPWREDDDDYVFGDARPYAEIHKGEVFPTREGGKQMPSVGSRSGMPSNGAGIDLFPDTARALGIRIGDNVEVKWRLLEDQPSRATKATV